MAQFDKLITLFQSNSIYVAILSYVAGILTKPIEKYIAEGIENRRLTRALYKEASANFVAIRLIWRPDSDWGGTSPNFKMGMYETVVANPMLYSRLNMRFIDSINHELRMIQSHASNREMYKAQYALLMNTVRRPRLFGGTKRKVRGYNL